MAKSSMGLRASRRAANITTYIILGLISIIWIVPFVLIVLQSFRVESQQIVNYVIPKKWGIDNYTYLFSLQSNFLQWYFNTFVIALIVAVLQTAMVLMMAYTLSRFRFKLRKGLMNLMLILGMFPGFLTMIVLYNVLKMMHLTGTYGNAIWGLVLVYVASSGMGYYVCKGFFDTIPKSLDEAARVDGATRLQVFYKIIMPLSKPIIIYTVLTAFMAPWGDFIFASLVALNAPQQYNVAVGLWSWMTKELVSTHYTYFCAAGVLISIPVVTLFMFLQRYYVEGVTGGAVKG